MIFEAIAVLKRGPLHSGKVRKEELTMSNNEKSLLPNQLVELRERLTQVEIKLLQKSEQLKEANASLTKPR